MKNKIKFHPEPSLLAFAEWFSSNYKKLPAGHYHSDPPGYSVKYMNRIGSPQGSPVTTLARISHNSGIIELDRSGFRNKKITEDFVFHVILWCVIKRKLFKEWGIESDFEADRIAVQHYVETQPQRSRKDIAIGWLVQLGRSPENYNLKKRYDATKEQLLKAQLKDDKAAKKIVKSKNKNEIKSRTFKINRRKGHRKRKK